MGVSRNLKIGNFTFGFQVNTGIFDGVIVDHDEAKAAGINSHEFIEAFAEALSLYPHFVRFADFLEEMQYTNAIYHMPRPELERVVKEAEWVLSQPYFTHRDVRARVYLKMCRDVLAGKPKPVHEKVTFKKERNTNGYVYLLKSVTGHYKIGRSKNPDDRKAMFGIKLPFEIDFVCVIKTPDMYLLEEELHQQYADKRINGEWFNLTDADVEYIKSLAEAE